MKTFSGQPKTQPNHHSSSQQLEQVLKPSPQSSTSSCLLVRGVPETKVTSVSPVLSLQTPSNEPLRSPGRLPHPKNLPSNQPNGHSLRRSLLSKLVHVSRFHDTVRLCIHRLRLASGSRVCYSLINWITICT